MLVASYIFEYAENIRDKYPYPLSPRSENRHATRSGSGRVSESHQILHCLESGLNSPCKLMNSSEMDSIQLALGENCGTLVIEICQ